MSRALPILLFALMASAPTMLLDDKSQGKTVKVAVGTVIVLRLDAQPGTGYAWHIAGKPKSLELVESNFEKLNSEGKVGMRERQVLRIRVTGKARTPLRLDYRRAWEKDVPPAKTFRMTVDSR